MKMCLKQQEVVDHMVAQESKSKIQVLRPRWHGKSMVEEMDERFVKMYKSVHDEG